MRNSPLHGVSVRFDVESVSVRNRCSVPSIFSFDPEAVRQGRQGPPITVSSRMTQFGRASDGSALGLAHGKLHRSCSPGCGH